MIKSHQNLLQEHTMARDHQIIIKNIRIQALSDTLLRLEERSSSAFEDRITFTVLDRDFPKPACTFFQDAEGTHLKTDNFTVIVPHGGDSLAGVSVESADGELLYRYEGCLPPLSNLPGPSDRLRCWMMADTPRLVPPPWGATPPPRQAGDQPDSGWQVDQDAVDIYIFIPGEGGYQQFRQDFLKLTGPVPLPPLFIFGLTDSRYHPYSEETALETIDTYRSKDIPLDIFVMDTDWRVGASHGYQINEQLFPDMHAFIKKAHSRNVRLMYNDHPEPYGDSFLDPAEIQYRYDSLTSLLKLGADLWWYDRNWMTHLHDPPAGLPRDVWGQRLYRDITRHFHPDRRPLIMSNAAGIEHGKRTFPPHPAEHRTPVWWTGDTAGRWDYLRMGIANGVDYGILGLMPYLNEDLGGHFGNPDDELYVRFVQYGVFSPVTRLHCTVNETRYPWAYSKEAEEIVSEYIRLRYRLLPTIYSAARRAFDDGTPLLQRGDLEWPAHPEARDPSQFTLGDDLLVAPMNTGTNDYQFIGADNLRTADGNPGLVGEYFTNTEFEDQPAFIKDEVNLNQDWMWLGAPDGLSSIGFSIRWSGKLVKPPETGEYLLGAYLCGMTRIELDGKQLIKKYEGDFTRPVLAKINLEKGQSYGLVVEYAKVMARGVFGLVWLTPTQARTEPTRSVWLPPGTWMDVWSGERLQGPRNIQVISDLWHTPLYLREGGLLFSLPQMQYTGERPWDEVIIDAVIPQEDGVSIRALYEDDGISIAYLNGKFCRTPVSLDRSGGTICLEIGAIEGDYPERLAQRSWCVRMHLPAGVIPTEVLVDGSTFPLMQGGNHAGYRLIAPGGTADEIPFRGRGSHPGPHGGDVLELWLPGIDTGRSTRIQVRVG